MKKLFLLMILSSALFAVENKDCCVVRKPKPKQSVRRVAPRLLPPNQKQAQDQDNEQEQDQNQHQTVNVHVHNNSESRATSGSRAGLRLGLHAGCGPNGVRARALAPGLTSYELKNELVVGGSVSVRVLGPVWITGQAFSNRMLTGGLEVEF